MTQEYHLGDQFDEPESTRQLHKLDSYTGAPVVFLFHHNPDEAKAKGRRPGQAGVAECTESYKIAPPFGPTEVSQSVSQSFFFW